MKLHEHVNPKYWQKRDEKCAAMGIRKVSNRRVDGEDYVRSAKNIHRLGAFCEALSCIGIERYSRSDALEVMKRALVQALSIEGCKPPHFKPKPTQFETSWAERLYLALRDVRILERGRGDVIAATVRLAELANAPIRHSMVRNVCDLSGQLEPQLVRMKKAGDARRAKSESKYLAWERMVRDCANRKPELRNNKSRLCVYAAERLLREDSANKGDAKTIETRLRKRSFDWSQ